MCALPSPTFSRLILESAPYLDFEASQSGAGQPWAEVDRWPARWVLPPLDATAPFLALFRLQYCLPQATQLRFHVSAHERYELFWECDGQRRLVGRGPTRAPAGFRHFETYDAEFQAGAGAFLVRVSQLERKAPWAQVSGQSGFLFAVQDAALWDGFNTGRAPWQTRLLNGMAWRAPREQSGRDMGCGAVEVASGEAIAPQLWKEGDWRAAATGLSGNNGFTLYSRPEVPILRSSPLPAQHSAPWRNLALIGTDEGESTAPFTTSGTRLHEEWMAFWKGGALTVPARMRRRFWLQSGDYVCAFPTLRGHGGRDATMRLAWAESLCNAEDGPVRQAPFDGAVLRGIWDEIAPGDQPEWSWTPTWWRCGLFLRLDIETAEDALVLDALELQETRYPFEPRRDFSGIDPQLRSIFERCVRSLQVCAHETYMDCPYYEQLQYLGDTRVQMLCSYALFGDDRLARLAIWTYGAAARNASQWMPSSAPANNGQRIGPFTLWWVEMLHDLWMWGRDVAFVRELLPTARSVVELWLQRMRGDGLVELPPGWNYLDAAGDLADLRGPFHGAAQWHVAGVLHRLVELETAAGETELAARSRRLADSVAQAGERFWNAERSLMADDVAHTHFSEQTNLLALRSGLLDGARGQLLAASLFDREQPDLTQVTIYFAHYAFEVARAHGRQAWMERRLAPWRQLEAEGLRTTPEHWGRTRSECHAWGAHPLLHFG
jgi:hypothetical protein